MWSNTVPTVWLVWKCRSITPGCLWFLLTSLKRSTGSVMWKAAASRFAQSVQMTCGTRTTCAWRCKLVCAASWATGAGRMADCLRRSAMVSGRPEGAAWPGFERTLEPIAPPGLPQGDAGAAFEAAADSDGVGMSSDNGEELVGALGARASMAWPPSGVHDPGREADAAPLVAPAAEEFGCAKRSNAPVGSAVASLSCRKPGRKSDVSGSGSWP
mmetsp:Transcript_7632/g.24407  ORF Transcript_7632/g.24407 Transcript_7632/m.24407 type:complete len:214 (-) Transcript_7632:757-1398(-)